LRAVLAVAPLGWSAVNAPPRTILPSAWRTMALTRALALGSNVVSRVPLALRRAMKLRVPPAMAEKEPATRILPSGWSVSAETSALGAG
jgi:hypothetical protein